MDKFDPTSLPDVPDIPASIIESGIADAPLLSRGAWHTRGWVGAVRRVAEGGDVDAFLDEAVAACRRL
jgi:hypothetical protein